MHKSIFFRRILAILLMAMLLWVALTALLYNLISRPIFTNIKVSELQPKAELIADLAARSFLDNDPYFDALLSSSLEIFDSWIFVVDGLSGVVTHQSLPDNAASVESEIHAQIKAKLPDLMSGEISSLWFSSHLRDPSATGELLFIGVPVQLPFGNDNTVIGTVFFVQPLAELNAGFNSMNIALLVASLAVFLLMIIPTYLATARLIRPLRQTRDVALAMAGGNFDVRADTRQKGEIGELAQTMNNLASELSANLSTLTLERNQLRQILEGMNEGLIAVDSSLRITQANQAVNEMLAAGNRIEPIHDFSQLADSEQLRQAYQQAIAENCEISISLLRNSCNIHGQIAPLCEESGQVAGAVGLFRDETEAVHLEQTRREYVANVSHELRTPLTAMRALIEPLKDGLVSQEADRQRYYGIMLREIIRLSRLINDMLELSRLQAGTSPMPIMAFDLAGILQDLEEKISIQAEDAELTLKMPGNLKSCPKVFGNPDRVEQVLVILVDNAIKFTPAGGVISLSLAWDEQQVLISVKDNGIGIAAEDIRKVFDRFYKADKAHQQPGTGLGLAIAREIMLQMGQTIQVSSESGQGSVFTFSLGRADLEVKETI